MPSAFLAVRSAPGAGLGEDTDAGSVAFAGGTYAQCDAVLGGPGSVNVSQNDGV